MKYFNADPIMIECPNTIFRIYIHNEDELSKVSIFMRNICNVNQLGLKDIYNWCNRQKIAYDTRFNYQKGSSIWKNMKSYIYYFRQKSKYQLDLQTV